MPTLVAIPQRVQKHFAEKHDLTLEEAVKRFDELAEFLGECAESDEALEPSAEVDEVWHAFILHTWLYARYCDELCGHFIHHRPFLQSEKGPRASSCNDGGGDGNCSNDCGRGDCNSGGDA